MPLDVTPLLTPLFAVLTGLVVLGAAAIAAAALRPHRRGGGPSSPARVRVEVRPPIMVRGARARSA